uniref:Protein Wnt-5 n=1 Tax=Halocynthia roretzi TaxID=7729 RepID=WNT5_HALRO|nr:RecName: Full=Protein Wnt-5; Flags: Precursor [Halocynthia roretzi]BAA21878.1 Wnt [Halocynthia roretzi]
MVGMTRIQSAEPVWILFVLTLYSSVLMQVKPQLWSVGIERKKLFGETNTSVHCDEIRGLSRNQRSLCRTYNDHMYYVESGSKQGVEECQWQFRGQRWNCSLASNASPDKIIAVGSKETAFTYAITSGGVVQSIARACKSGNLMACGCSKRERPTGLGKDWNWGGCGDDIDYAYGFAHEFIDAQERDNSSPNDRRVKSHKAMNIHNNEAGRLSVVRASHTTCKCHGVSGSCSIKTCWLQTPQFRTIGDKLRQRYDDALEMRVTHRGQMKTRFSSDRNPSNIDLVYIDSSPDYCKVNHKLGILGTSGRECQLDSLAMDGCGLMCCGRGYTTKMVEVVKSCNCKFQWCCFVKCQQCKEKVLKHICN